MQSSYIDEIERIFQGRSNKTCLYVPSGRIAIYLAIMEYMEPGDKILMSPVNDDVVFWTILAAGLKPVLAPFNYRTGNIDVSQIDESSWAELKGVMTTNLYGIADNVDAVREKCQQHKLLFFEDACQAVDSYWRGKRVGEMGDIAFFSFSKQVKGVGGILSFADHNLRDTFCNARDCLLDHRSSLQSIIYGSKRVINDCLGDNLWQFLTRQKPADLSTRSERSGGHRMPFNWQEVSGLYGQSRELLAFDHWVRVDNSNYRIWPLQYELKKTLRHIKQLPQQREKRIAGAKKLRDLGLTPSYMEIPMDEPLHRYPLFVKNRESVIAEFARHGMFLDYIYDPPLNLYAPEQLVDTLPSDANIALWSEHILPVNPLYADQFIHIKNKLSPLLPA